MQSLHLSLALNPRHEKKLYKLSSILGCPTDCWTGSSCTDDRKGIFVDVRYFQLGYVNIPGDVEERFLRALTLQEDALKEELLQNATVVRAETEQKVGFV